MSVFDALQHSPVFFLSSILVLGLLVGSFLNVVIHRLPLMLKQQWRADCEEFLAETAENKTPDIIPAKKQTTFNLVHPRSRCPHCGHQITALENIPVISYLFLKGRCSECMSPISIRYPLIETISGLMVFTVAWKLGFSAQAGYAMLLTWVLIALTFIDLDHFYLPDNLVLPFLWLGLLVNLADTFTDIKSAVIGAAAGYLVLWSVYQFFKKLTGKEGMGYGDFKLLAMLGAWLGWQMLPVIIILSSFVGTVVGISLIVFKNHQRNQPIPFGPYLATAGWIALLWGEQINQAYLNWLTV
ncbi:MAG: A24 family peptidase [Gammaproteobacteria bacterium]